VRRNTYNLPVRTGADTFKVLLGYFSSFKNSLDAIILRILNILYKFSDNPALCSSHIKN